MTETDRTPRERSNWSGSIFAGLGILLGAASLVSLIQRWTGVETVAKIAADALALYRQMMEQFHWVIFSWWTPVDLPWGWTFEMPAWGMDLISIWVLSFAAQNRERPFLVAVSFDYFERSDLTNGDEKPITPNIVNYIFRVLVPYFFGYIALSPIGFFFRFYRFVRLLIYSVVTYFQFVFFTITDQRHKLIGDTEEMNNIIFNQLKLSMRGSAYIVILLISPIFLVIAFFAWNATQISA